MFVSNDDDILWQKQATAHQRCSQHPENKPYDCWHTRHESSFTWCHTLFWKLYAILRQGLQHRKILYLITQILNATHKTKHYTLWSLFVIH